MLFRSAPRIGTSLNTEFIKGMGKQNETFVIILDIDRCFSGESFDLPADLAANG